jgi:hypothetical protein
MKDPGQSLLAEMRSPAEPAFTYPDPARVSSFSACFVTEIQIQDRHATPDETARTGPATSFVGILE